MGRNLNCSLGKLKYVVESAESGLSTGAKAGIGVLSAFLLILFGAGCVYHKKRTARQKEKLQNDSNKQIEAIKMEVMDECKEGKC